MNINERIKFFRTEISKNNKGKNYSQRQFAEQIGVSHGVINNIESNLVDAKDHIVKLICQTFNVNEDWLRNGNEPIFNEKEETSITELLKAQGIKPMVLQIIENYLKMTDDNKKAFDNYLKQLLGVDAYNKAVENSTKTFDELSISKDDIKNIHLYEIPASAGTGSFITDDVPYEIKQVDLTIVPQARKADFALYVRGDSMEPDYYDGDIVFIKEQPSIDNGQIGIFIYDNEAYIKKYSIQEDGIYLISLNKKYKPIKVDENSCFKVCGLVL